jgi:two-component system chemotaxis sensor kinase CheA
MKIDTARYRETFFDEAGEHLSTLEAALLKLDAGLANADAVDAAFRAMHSVKGGADAVGFPAIAQFTHVLEELFDHFRAHPGPVSRPMLDLVLEAADVLTELIRTVRRAEPPPETENILARLEQARRAPEPSASLTTYSITVVPHEDSLRTGLDPIPLFRELASLGKVLSVRLNAKGLPPLAQLDPEKCYLAWTISLQTHRSRQEGKRHICC